jgi:hypothetical protein
MLKTALAAIAAFTLFATVFLSLSLVILQPPRANFQQWFLMAALIVAQDAMTLVALGPGARSRGWTRWPLAAGAVAVVGLAGTWAYTTVRGAHFEGYALVLGTVLVVQGVVTLAYLTPRLVEPRLVREG